MALTNAAVRDLALGRGGTYSTSRDIISHQIWDTWFTTAVTALDHTYFQQPIGSPHAGGGNKTHIDTNVFDTGKLPNGQTFLMKDIAFFLVPGDQPESDSAKGLAQAFYDIMDVSVIEIRIAGREYDFQIHGRQFLPTVALSTPMDQASVWPNNPSQLLFGGIVSLDPTPIYLDQLVTFSVSQTLYVVEPTVQNNIDVAFDIIGGESGSIRCSIGGVLTRAK
jgi:hypothetical protein